MDTGANISVIPRQKGTLSKPLPFKLYAANNTVISTYGEKTLTLDFKLRRPYKWKFIVADVSKPILGADFLNHHHLLVDLKNRRLIDSTTSLAVKAPARVSNLPTVRSIDPQISLHHILEEFPGTTRLTSMKLNPKHNVEHFIETSGPPIHSRARPIPPHRYERVKKEFENMIEQGLCRPSKSPWSSPLHIVPKKNGDLRVCGDYRRLNAITKPDRYPIPRVKDFTYQLAGKKFFSTIDLNRAYQQIKIADTDVEKTAIITPFGLYEFPRMCPGLKNAGQTFQRFIHEVLRGLDFVFTFVDDLLLTSRDEHEGQQHLRTVLNRLEEYGITINPSKCVLGQKQVKFLGYTVSEHGIKPTEEKTSTIKQFPKPNTVEELRRFLGMLNFYRDHIPHAASIQAPLNQYLHNSKKKDKTVIQWNNESLESFEKCKESISNATLLAHPRHSVPLALMCDASDTGAGSAIQQLVDNQWQPLGYFSKKFSEAQQKYCTYDKELLAIYMSVKHFRKMFEGRELIIFTDHKPLIYAFTKSNADNETPRRTRQLLFISEFTTDIRHISGKYNTVADALSRIEDISHPSAIDYDKLASAQEKDSLIPTLLQQTNIKIKKIGIPTSTRPIYCEVSTQNIRPYLPDEFRLQAYNAVHGLSHPGIRTTRKLIQQRYFWPSMNEDVGKWTKACIACQKAKIQKHTNSPTTSFAPADRFAHVHIDIVGPLPTSPQSHRYCVTMIDRATRWPEAFPTEDITAETIAKIFYEGWVSRFGCPEKITTDQGRQFESRLFTALTNILGIQKIHTTPYHPQSNGVIERWHRCMKNALKARLQTSSTWTSELPTVLLGLRAAIRSDSDVSAAQLTYGRTLRLPGDMFTPSSSHHSDVMDYSYVDNLRATIQSLQSPPFQSHSRNRTTFIHTDLLKCRQVFVRDDSVRKPLQSPYKGPFEVTKRSEKVFTVKLPDREAAISIDRLKPAYLLNEDDVTQDNTYQPPKTTRSGRAVRPPVRFA